MSSPAVAACGELKSADIEKSEEKFGKSRKKRYLCSRKQQDMKKLVNWIKSTKWWMNRNNRKNKVEILTEEEYFLLWNGKVVEAL